MILNFDMADIHALLKAQEAELLPYPRISEEQVSQRRIAVEWMKQAGVSKQTIQLAVALLDRLLLPETEISNHGLQMIASGCLQLAARFEEPVIPADQHTPQILVGMESFLAEQLNCDIITVTPLHFLSYYLDFVLAPEELATKTLIVDQCEQLLNLALLDHEFVHYRPSTVASAAMLIARKMLLLQPSWPPHLQELTGYSFEDVEDCAARLERLSYQTMRA